MQKIENQLVRLSFFLFFLSFFACKKENEMPLSQEKLVSVLMDVHVAESAILHLPDNQKDSLLTKYYDQLCTIHEVKRNDLDTCINRLKSDPFLAETMYGKVLTGLEKLNIDR